VVQRSGETGSPTSRGSISDSSAAARSGSRSAADLRPPPGLRTRPKASAPSASSSRPRAIVDSETSANLATAAIPPCPSASASEARYRRRCRSSRCGNTAANFVSSTARTSSGIPTAGHLPCCAQKLDRIWQ
jgi:hypothetical protein